MNVFVTGYASGGCFRTGIMGEDSVNARPHPGPLASQARHQMVARYYGTASQYVVPLEREVTRRHSGTGCGSHCIAWYRLVPLGTAWYRSRFFIRVLTHGHLLGEAKLNAK
jgi:hypothetical protein